MQKILCIGCDEAGGIEGLLFGVPTLPICRRCVHASLTFIRAAGIPMNTDHVLINELVEGTLLHGRGFWRYYDYIEREGMDVMRVVK